MGWLSAAGTQQPDCRGSGIGSSRVEVVENDVHLAKQRVVAHADGIQIIPGQRADVQQQIEGFGNRGLKAGLPRGLLTIEILKISVQGVIVGGGGRLVVRKLAALSGCVVVAVAS